MAIIHAARVQILDGNGDPVSGAKAYFYDTGTTTPKTVYADTALTTAHQVPLEADSEGFLAPVYFSGGAVKVNVTDADDVQLSNYPIDPAVVTADSSTTAAGISFVPATGITSTNVQDAIEEVQSNIDGVTSYDFRGKTLQWDSRQIVGDAVALATTTAAGVVEKSTTSEETTGTEENKFPDVPGVVNIIKGQPMGWDFWESPFVFDDDGSQETVTSSALEDDYEYMAFIQNVGHDSGSNQSLKVKLIRESDSGGTAIQITEEIANSAAWEGTAEFGFLRKTLKYKPIFATIAPSTTLNPTWGTDGGVSALISGFARVGWATQTATGKVSSIEFSTSAGVNFDQGSILLFRRIEGG